MSALEQKRYAGEAAALEVVDGMAVGLGTGSTAEWFVRALGERVRSEGLQLRCVVTSEATAQLASRLGLVCEDLDTVGRLDITVDGADEMSPDLHVIIKGGGGALLREKLVWKASERCLVIADESKLTSAPGAFPLAVEVTPFGHATTAARLTELTEAPHRLRMAGSDPFQTDNGNLIYDLRMEVIPEADWLDWELKVITGVVDHGLFCGLATDAFIGTDTGVVILTRSRNGDR